MQQLIILIGLPGSGKTSWARVREATSSNTVWLSSDNMRKELYGDEAIQGNPNTVFTRLHARVKEELAAGKSVIYDATNINRKQRKTIINIGKQFKDVTIHGQIIWATIDECIQRDASRERHVGIEVIDKMIRRWESPYFDEGFASISISINSEYDPAEYHRELAEAMKIPHDNPHHSLPVYDHCLEAQRILKYSNVLDPAEIFAAYLHDCGKPYTKFFKPESDHAHFYSHDNVGGYLVYGACENMSVSETLLISWLVSNHMQPFFNSNYYKNLPDCLKAMLDQLHNADINAH